MLDLTPLEIPKAADVLANVLREQILDGQLGVGISLPSERELAQQSGLSRATVREALLILEVEGLVTTRTGRNGGTEVMRPRAETVQRSIQTFIRGQGVRFESVLQAREAIEPQSARLAAMRHTAADWTDLLERHQAIQACIADIPAFLQANLAWHVCLVRASHNELLIAFTQAISQAVYEATDLRGFNSPDVRQAVVMAHQKVMDAIQARDADAAWRRMGRHVGAYVRAVDRRAKEPPARKPARGVES
ncbi:MAG: FCD domain-containing protein [Comamonadaceae bacterium]|nr:FCD domain-containing protein [Comamonadaceae bacterium]